MKKTSIATIITASVSLILLVVSTFFIVWDRNDAEATSSLLITAILSLAVAMITTILFAIFFGKKHKILNIIPVILLFVIAIIYTQQITLLVGQNFSIIDFLSPTNNNPTVLAFILFVAFITAIVLIEWKGYKFASVYAIAYAALLLAATFINTAQILFLPKNMLYILSSFGLLFALAAMIINFTAPFVTNNDIVIEKKEKPVEEKKEETPAEETKSEEKVEDTPVEEAPAEEEKKEETNNDPFKNQYSSSSTVFDVQDDAEKEE